MPDQANTNNTQCTCDAWHEPHDHCAECGNIQAVGHWPFCPHGEVVTRNANFTPIVYYENARGKRYYSDRPPRDARGRLRKEYERREITNRTDYKHWQRTEDRTAARRHDTKVSNEQRMMESHTAAHSKTTLKTDVGRAFRDAVIAKRDGGYSSRYDAGNHNEALD